MMRYFVLIICFFLILIDAKGQSGNQGVNNVYTGYQSALRGESIRFHSSNPEANEALVARCSDSDNIISWKTTIIPDNYDQKYISFAWLAGLATGNNRDNSSYDLYINNKKEFHFTIDKKRSRQNWSLENAKDYRLAFIQDSTDDNKDSYGFMYLKVPVDDYQKGKPLSLRIESINTGRYDDWYMLFKYAVMEECSLQARPLLRKNKDGHLQQLVDLHINHVFPTSGDAVILIDGTRKEVEVKTGYNNIECWISALQSPKNIAVKVGIDGLFSRNMNANVSPVKKREVYLLPCSHTDIGYSDLQAKVAKKHVDYIQEAMEIIDTSRKYPDAAQFKWNVESLWSVDHFMKTADEKQKARFINDVRTGNIGLSAGYINLLTGVCRPEELIHWTDYSDTLRRHFGIVLKSLMISDVPGMSWNVVAALSQKGIRYISDGPNYIAHQESFPDMGGRVGATHRAMGDRPFYWVSPSGTDTVLFWQAGKGYSWFQDWNVGRFGTQKSKDSLLNYMAELEKKDYPYDMVQLRYSIINDNQPPDPGLSAFVNNWNEKFVSPKLIISSVDKMMKSFEQRYGAQLPVMAGDFTPYWADGVMSTAREELLVKHSVERLYQSEVLNGLLYPGNYDGSQYDKAWHNIIMWHEHTWGAWNSVSHPDDSFAIKQWLYKQKFALAADSITHKLLNKSIHQGDNLARGFDVINTSSWTRTDLVILAPAQSAAGDLIVDKNGEKYPSQRLSDGSLAFLAKNIPALGRKRFFNKRGKSHYISDLKISNNVIENNAIRLILDGRSGAIKSLIDKKMHKELVDTGNFRGLNQYVYMAGKDPSDAVSVDDITIRVKEKGPLIATFEITSKAAGTQQLVQRVSLINEINKISITDALDKIKVREKESVHFAFPINMTEGQIRFDLGTISMNPDKNQLPGANKDYFCVQRWVDVSNDKYGLTLTTPDAPLVEEGALVDERPYVSSESYGGTSGEKKWKEHITKSNTFFSYIMNNYWYTNYKADQEGKVVFHYAIYLHNQFDPAGAARRGIEASQSLLINGQESKHALPFLLDDKNILLTSVKPAASGNGMVLRLYNASSKPEHLHFQWSKVGEGHMTKMYLSNAVEDKLRLFDTQRRWEPFAVKTLYIE